MTRYCEWCDEPATVAVDVKKTRARHIGDFRIGYTLRACKAHEKQARHAASNWSPASEGSLADEMEAA